jgi:hypothetical protein
MCWLSAAVAVVDARVVVVVAAAVHESVLPCLADRDLAVVPLVEVPVPLCLAPAVQVGRTVRPS